ncbi:hypothetical protein [Tropicimonas aquimaris]|uniref:Uncharacterized protein n=1 Tax=Tropicimonas aquimaris TaxID=914152 RepID=A0ABW3IVL7_9RHOB
MRRENALHRGLIALTLAFGMASVGNAQAFADDFRESLYAGDTAAALARARTEIEAQPQNGTARFAIGAASFLGAIEGLTQGLYRHGISNGEGSQLLAMGEMPFLRLPIAANPSPEPVTYQALRGILIDFGDRLAEAEAALTSVEDRPVALELDLARIKLDTDGQHGAVPAADLLRLFSAVSGVRTGTAALVVDFDSADAVWLQAYFHVLMTMSDVLLAHDWEAAYLATMEGMFPDSFTPRTALNDLTRDGWGRMIDLQMNTPPQPNCDWDEGEDCEEQWDTYHAHPAMQEMRALERAMQFRSIADLAAFVHLTRWPVVQPERMASALAHMEAMVALSRENWRRILAETDQGREWIQSPSQTGALPNMEIDQPRVDGWLGFLDQLDAVLSGELLLPHWRFAQGFNLRRMFLEPEPFDLVLLVQGTAMIPFLEDGPVARGDTWRRTTEVFSGQFFRYFVWIN